MALLVISILIVVLLLLLSGLRVVQQYERSVIFVLGRKNSTIIFPLPLDIIGPLMSTIQQNGHHEQMTLRLEEHDREPHSAPRDALRGS